MGKQNKKVTSEGAGRVRVQRERRDGAVKNNRSVQ